MAFSELQVSEIKKAMDSYMWDLRPDQEFKGIRETNYTIDDDSVVIRFHELTAGQKHTKEIAKAYWDAKQFLWRVFCWGKEGQWTAYDTKSARTIQKFIELVEADDLGSFWG